MDHTDYTGADKVAKGMYHGWRGEGLGQGGGGSEWGSGYGTWILVAKTHAQS